MKMNLNTIFFMLTVAGLHVNMKMSNSKATIIATIYCCCINLLLLVSFVEEMYCVSLMDIPFFIAFFLTFCAMCYFWTWIKTLYILIHREQLNRLFQLWDSLEPQLDTENRQILLQKMAGRVMKNLKYMFGIIVTPYMVIGASKLYSSTLFVPSAFAYNEKNKKELSIVVLYQTSSVIYLNTTWIAFEGLLLLLIDFLVTELDYLNVTLNRILEDLQVAQELKQKEFYQIRIKLTHWIHHHGKVINFSTALKRFFAPLVAGQYIFLITIMCGLLYCSASGRLPAENASYCYVTAVGYTYLTYLSCRNGDAVEEKGLLLAGKKMPTSWVHLPLDIKKTLLIIQLMAQKSLSFDIHGHEPLNSTTFRKMLILQYRFYRFMADAQ